MATPRIIDVREFAEYANGAIPGSELVPLGSLPERAASWDKSAPLTLVCKSGKRASQARSTLAEMGFSSLQVLPGGMDAWTAQGKPVEAAEGRHPWAMDRQVRTAAGSLIVVTMGLGFLVSRKFLIGTALVGAGLVFSGVSNTCMMASVLARMPWNQDPGRS